MPDPGDSQGPPPPFLPRRVPPVPPHRGAEARLPWSAPKPFAYPAPGPGTEPCSPPPPLGRLPPPVPSCSRRSPQTPLWVSTHLAPAGLSWRVAWLHPHGTVPRGPGDAELVGAPCVGLSRGWGTLGTVTPPASWARVYGGCWGSLGTHGCSPPRAQAHGDAVGWAASCRHPKTAAAEGLLVAPRAPPALSPQARWVLAGSRPGRFLASAPAAFLGGGRNGAGAWHDSALATRARDRLVTHVEP